MNNLNKFELWLKTHLPEVLSDLMPPANIQDIKALESELNIKLPDNFIELYQWHDGQRMEVNTGPWYGLNFLHLEKVRKECLMWREVLVESSEESLISLSKSMKSTPDFYVKKVYASKCWVPFAYDWGGNYLGVDLDPDVNGTVGQVINFGRDEERKIAVAPSINKFLDWMVAELESGNFNINVENDGGRSFNTLNPLKFHFLDSLAEIFPEK